MKRFRKEGFTHQRLIVLPTSLRIQLSADPFVRQLYLTDIGIFPSAENHLVERDNGTNEYVLQFCFDGEGFSQFNGERHSITTGQYFLLPPGEKHSYGSSVRGGWKVGWIHLLGHGAELFAERVGVSNFGKALDFKASKDWLGLFGKVLDSLETDLTYINIAHNCSFLWPMLIEMVFHEKMNSFSSGDPIECAIRFMKENTGSPLSLQEMASSANLSVSRFSAVFKNKKGQSPNEYFLK